METIMSTAKKMNIDAIRKDFPILSQIVHGKPLCYLDNAATTQKPQAVIDAINDYYTCYNANVHRGVHALSEKSTKLFEDAREVVRQFINAASTKEVIFTRSTTEAINLVAQSYGRTFLQAGDEILITMMEHHSNIVPWQILCEQQGCKLVVAPINDAGELLLNDFANLISEKTKLIAVNYVSNAIGTINPVKDIVTLAKSNNIPVLIDAAQAASHVAIDVADIDCDFLALSGHKVFGPTGIGVLYGKEKHLQAMPPYQGGGEMILKVDFKKTVYNQLPYKFEAGTPNIAGAVGLATALRYVESIGFDNIINHEQYLLEQAKEILSTIPGLKFIGTATHHASVISFVIDGIHPHDLGTIVDQDGVAIRTGHHCAMPLMEFFNVPATARASFAFYNTVAEIERLAQSLLQARKLMGL